MIGGNWLNWAQASDGLEPVGAGLWFSPWGVMYSTGGVQLMTSWAGLTCSVMGWMTGGVPTSTVTVPGAVEHTGGD